MSNPQPQGASATTTKSSSLFVAAGILLSRISGLIREAALAAVFGNTPTVSAFRMAMKIPNVMQNLLGEGVLSASFIPVYSDLLDEDDDQARSLVGNVGGLLIAITAGLVAIGVLLAGPIMTLLAPGFDAELHALATKLMRITTAGIGLLVLSALCLGILNSHRNFFLPYVAPVIWNVAQIVMIAVAGFAGWSLNKGITALAWGVLGGSALQLLVQLPTVRRLVGSTRFTLSRTSNAVRDVLRRFAPTLLGRGVVQISALIDGILASLLVTTAVSTIAYSQVLYILPISLFAMSVAAAELPELSREKHDDGLVAQRSDRGQRRIAFFMLFTAVAFIAVGDLIIGALLERGKFTADSTLAVWLVLAVLALALPVVGSSRLLQNVFYAKGDTRTPAKVALLRVVVAIVVGASLMFPFDKLVVAGRTVMGETDPRAAGLTELPHLGPVGLAIGLVVATWVEFFVLNSMIRRMMPTMRSPLERIGNLALPAAGAFLLLAILKLLLNGLPVLISAPLIVGVGGFAYVVMCFRRGIGESELVLRPIRRLIWR